MESQHLLRYNKLLVYVGASVEEYNIWSEFASHQQGLQRNRGIFFELSMMRKIERGMKGINFNTYTAAVAWTPQYQQHSMIDAKKTHFAGSNKT